MLALNAQLPLIDPITETVALLDSATNPAIGRGEPNDVVRDQRDAPRDGQWDIGAFELEPSHGIKRGTGGGEHLAGSSDGEALFGLSGHDRLYGRAGNDLLDGGPGSDRLHAGKGGDIMIGGGAADLFVFGAGSHSRPSAPDLILDFSPRQGDQFDLRQLDADPDRSGNQRLDFIGRHTFTDAGQVRTARVDGHTEIKVNLDHDAHAELAIQLHDAIDLHRGDFLL